jgi:hypothetical protein
VTAADDVRAIADRIAAFTVCHGGEEQYEMHVRYCIPVYDEMADLATALRATATHIEAAR